MHRPRSAKLICALLLGLGAPLAHANGRFPATSSIHFHPRDPQKIFVGTTYGAVTSSDAGRTWSWICEASMHYGGGLDPVFLYSRRGDLYGATFGDLMISRDGGCTWTPQPDLVNRGAGDVVEDPQADDVLYVPTSGAQSDANPFNALFKSTDGGRTFAPTTLRPANAFLSSIRIAKADPRRFYVGGWRAMAPRAALVYRSDDGGETFRELTQDVGGPPQYFYVLGVHPTNADVVFTLVAVLGDGGELGDILRRSDDGGQTSTVVLHDREGIKHMAFSADGQTVFVAGLSKIYRSTDGGRTFAPLPKPTKNACVSHDGTSVWACGWQFDDGFAVGKSESSGDTFTKVYNLAELTGVLSCPSASTTTTQCTPLWSQLATLLGVRPSDGGPSDAGASDGGTAPAPKTGCGCDGTSAPVTFAALGLVLALLGLRRLNRGRRAK